MVVLDLFSPARAAALRRGVDAARAACAASFPPRPEDPRGTLVPLVISTETNRRVREHVQATTEDAQGRRWWMEGLVIGFAQETVASLLRSEPATQTGADEQLRAMRSAVLRRLSGENAAAADAVFSVLDAVAAEDPVALPWAVETMWVPGAVPAQPLVPAQVEARVRAVASTAVMTCCAAWAIEVGCQD